MTDDEADDGGSEQGPGPGRNRRNPKRPTLRPMGLGPAWPADLFAKLDVLSSVQRNFAATNFSALSAAQRSIDTSQLTKIAGFASAQDSIARKFAGAVDFSWLGERWMGPAGADQISGPSDASHVWGSVLEGAVNISALDDAVRASGGLVKLQGLDGFLSERLRLQSEALARIAESPIFDLPKLDLSKFRNAFLRWIPMNLQDVDDLDAVATMALEDGLPVSWVPRTEIVLELVACDSAAERREVLDRRRAEILADCEEALDDVDHEWATQCRVAVATLRAGLDPAAQSHAANIVDSIVLALYGGLPGRKTTTELAQEELGGVPLQLASENLTLRPLFRAFTHWWPSSGTEPPEHFARHVTAHAVGHVGVFAAHSALVAVMLATSLTAEYVPLLEDEETAGAGDDVMTEAID